MLKYVEKDEYIGVFGIESIPDDFETLVIEASSYINFHTFRRIDINEIPVEVKYVTCLIINLINKANIKKVAIGNLKSQNIEGWSETYETPENIDIKLETDKAKVLRTYLSDVIGKDGNYLLYRGD